MYTKVEVNTLLQKTEDEDILTNYTKTQLSRMYEAVYGRIGYPSGWRKRDILRAMRKYFAGIERAQRLKP